MSSSPSSSNVPPPPLVLNDDPSNVESARQRLKPSSRFPISLSMPNLRKPRVVSKQNSKFGQRRYEEDSPDKIPSTSQQDFGATPVAIQLNGQSLDDNEYQDRYEWAILYENQRGITLFSTPYYSSNSLLPSDPPPFTVPNTAQKRSHQPNVSLTEYPLPDGNWRWVSKSWMIDMRTDSGEVELDGFEYNWIFRRHHWRAQVGTLSAGGLVRRRRWVRLMMRPGKKTKQHEEEEDAGLDARTPSLQEQQSVVELSELWRGDVEEDWKMCRYFLRMAGRDGAKLDLWKRWLGLEKFKEPTSPNDESEAPPPAPPFVYVIAVLRAEVSLFLVNCQ
ncbi:hypothetical protein Moror_9718 [Moniliophthora roreri MCA 2997]|uniref:TECPR1-like DysF domain-containing protein n=1 Tax=Moniliophthora roreri (strain MCA 2997) TaxID=1381753 RepID=V2WYL8_MONRO|nr:hypothetical protein Moror_9718 [Moniliophthora roreri MCA 2997]